MPKNGNIPNVWYLDLGTYFGHKIVMTISKKKQHKLSKNAQL